MFGRKKKERVYDDDDGHVIAPMNIEGMPWYRKEMPGEDKNKKPELDISKEQRRYVILGALKAGLLIALAFIAVFFLIILIMWLVATARFG